MSVSGPTPEKPSYSNDFKESVDLFEKSFQGMQQAKFDAQKEQYVKVMHEALKTMQESANGMLNQHLAALKDNLSKDLNSYLSSPTDQHKEQVESDLNKIKEEE